MIVSTRAIRRSLVVSAALALACNPLVYSELGDESPVRTALPTESNDNANFAIVLSTFDSYNAFGTTPVDLSGRTPEGRIAVTNGPGSTWEVFGDDPGGAISLERQFTVCADIFPEDGPTPTTMTGMAAPCGTGTGAGIIGLPRYRVNIGGSQQYAYDCVLGSYIENGPDDRNQEGSLVVNCESAPGGRLGITRQQDIGFGTALVGVPWDDPNTPYGENGILAVVGAPTSLGSGDIFFVTESSVVRVERPADLTLPSSALFGTTLAVTRGPDTLGLTDTLLIAVGARGQERVYLFAYGFGESALEPGTNIWQTKTIGCVDGVRTRAPYQGEGSGSGLAFGDVVTGNAGPELILANVDPRLGIYALEDFMGADNGCTQATTDDDPNPSGGFIACPSDQGVIDCSPTSAFGSSLASGDLDNDGDDDIVVGIPQGNQGTATRAGAVLVIPGNGGSPPNVADASWLTTSSTSADSRLGSQVAVVELEDRSGERRAQVVASSPGDQKLFVFMCSGLGDDVTPACLPPT